MPLGEVKKQWIQWVNQIPVIVFNSGKYDINMMKKFLNVKNYIGPGLNYDTWCKSVRCRQQKLKFPYEWLDSYEKLSDVGLDG